MPDRKVVTTAKFKAKPGEQENLKKVLQQQAAEARGDKGCLKFDLLQDRTDETVFMFEENWAGLEDFENHLKAPYLGKYRGMREPYLDGPAEVTSFWQINE